MAFTSNWFQTKDLSGHWSKSIKDLPEKFGLDSIRRYLIDSTDKSFDKDSVRAFKSLKAYKYFQEGFVQKIYTCQARDVSVTTGDMFLAKAEVMASMEKKVYKVILCIDQDGDVQGGSCKCVAGKGSVCSHMAGLLFALQDYVAQGFLNVPEDQACTEILNQWNRPAKRQVEHTTIDNIPIYRPQLGRQPKESKPRNISKKTDRIPDQAALIKLHAKMKELIPNCGFVKYGLSTTCESVDDVKNDSPYMYIDEHPPNISDIMDGCDKLMADLQLDSSEIQTIENSTRAQSKSKLWYVERRKRITASNFHAVLSKRPTTDPTRLIKTILGYTRVSTKEMKFGLQKEEVAKQRYLDSLQASDDYQFRDCGLLISEQFPFIGASADGVLVNSDGAIVKLIELKNPPSTWNMTLSEASLTLGCLKLGKNKKTSLNRKHMYFTQIQGQMGVYGVQQCDFVLCTAKDMHVETIDFDEDFWRRLVPKLKSFYYKHIAPEIVYPRIKFGQSPVKY